MAAGVVGAVVLSAVLWCACVVPEELSAQSRRAGRPAPPSGSAPEAVEVECLLPEASADASPRMCAKEPMAADGIVRLSKIEVYPEYLDAYVAFAVEVGRISLLTEPGVLTMYAVAEQENPCRITILESYASRAAYERHIASEHFRLYKQGTLHMVRSLELLDQTPLNPDSRLVNLVR